MKLQFVVEGLHGLIAKADPDILRGPLLQFWRKAGQVEQANIRAVAPVDTGRYWHSIGWAIDRAPMPMFVEIGPNVGGMSQVPTVVAAVLEFGSGNLNELGATGVHYPPPRALAGWASRKGLNPYAVAKAIAKRGGLRPKRPLRTGHKNSLGQLQGLIRELAAAIGQAWRQ